MAQTVRLFEALPASREALRFYPGSPAPQLSGLAPLSIV